MLKHEHTTTIMNYKKRRRNYHDSTTQIDTGSLYTKTCIKLQLIETLTSVKKKVRKEFSGVRKIMWSNGYKKLTKGTKLKDTHLPILNKKKTINKIS